MATYRFPRMLTLLAWEDELRRDPCAAGGAPYQGDHGSPSPGFLARRVRRLRGSGPGLAIARRDREVGNARHRHVAGDFGIPAERESGAGPTLAERRARARGDALIFMRQVGFLQSLQAPHWEKNPVRVLDRAVPGAQELGSTSGLPESDPHNHPYQRRRVFLFRWLEPMPAAQLRESESFIAVAAGLEDLGLRDWMRRP